MNTRLYRILLFAAVSTISTVLTAQPWISFRLTPKGDTINRLDKNNVRQGPWFIRLDEVRGEPGYEEQGYFVDSKKEGAWTRFNLMGDVIAREFYKFGYRDGKQLYYSRMGDLIREESWRSVNPANPYDTIVVPDIDHPDRMVEKVIKHESAEVKHGTWTYYDGVTGAVVKTEHFVFGQVDKSKSPLTPSSSPLPKQKEEGAAPAKKPVPAAIQQYQKNKKGKG